MLLRAQDARGQRVFAEQQLLQQHRRLEPETGWSHVELLRLVSCAMSGVRNGSPGAARASPRPPDARPRWEHVAAGEDPAKRSELPKVAALASGGPRGAPSSAPWGRDDARAPRDPATWRPLACPPRPRLLFPPPSPPPVTVSLSKMRSHGRAPSADLPLRPRTPPRPGASAGRRGSIVKRSARSFHHVHLKSEFGFLGLSTYSHVAVPLTKGPSV